MSLQLYSKIPGTQVKRDANLSNAMVQCDPTALYPLGATQAGVPLNKENLAGKLGVEHDICNLDLNNLTVNGVLVAKGPAEVCDIVCPVDFTVTAGDDIIMSAADDVSINAVGNLNLNADDGAASANVNINATRRITADAAAGISMTGGSRGINLNIADPDSTTERLGLTQANGTVTEAVAGDVNGVCGAITFDNSTIVAAGNGASVPIQNAKVIAGSIILITLDTTGLGAIDFITAATSSIINGGYRCNISNVGAGAVDLQGVSIHYLVLNAPQF